MSSKHSNVQIFNFAPIQIVTNTQKRANEGSEFSSSTDIQPPPHKKRKIFDKISLVFQENRHLLKQNRHLLQQNHQLLKENEILLLQKEWFKKKLNGLKDIINQCWGDDVPLDILPPFTEITETNETLRVLSHHLVNDPTEKRLFRLPQLRMDKCPREHLLMDLDNLINVTDEKEEMICDDTKIDKQRSLSQNVLSFGFDINAKQKKNDNTMRINEALDIANRNEQRKYLKELILETPNCTDTIQFYIGNSYETAGDANKAIEWYNKSLVTNYRNRKYFESLTVYHKAVCVLESKGIHGIHDDTLHSMVESWRNTVSNDNKYQLIRKEWIRRGEVVFELIGAARCANFLARYYADKDTHTHTHNDTSLIWYKRALNILEKLKVIIIKTVPMDQVMSTSCDKQRMLCMLNRESKDKQMVERKRLNEVYSDLSYLKTAEDVTQNYMQCIIERFRKNEYGIIEEDISKYQCFVDFHNLKEEYSSNFELYLEYELDSMFEINHEYFKHSVSRINNNDQEIADVYINYASYLTDVRAKHEASLVLFEHALEWNKDAIACWNMAEIYEKMEKYEESVKYLDLVVEYTRKDSYDYTQTMQEVDQLKKRIKKKRNNLNTTNTL